jgi:hypothetical protein
MIGKDDFVDCWNGSISGCTWAALNFTPGVDDIKWAVNALKGARDAEDAAKAAKAAKRAKALKDAGKCLTKNSFAPDTKVLTADGKSKPIKDLKVGDDVKTGDPTTGKPSGSHKITATMINHDSNLLDVVVTTADGHRNVLHTTTEHPFWDDTAHAWVDAAALTPGHMLVTATNQTVAVTGIFRLPSPAKDMYNLTVQDLHTYYVLAGSTPVLVHNSGICGKTALENGDWQHILDRHRPGGALVDDEAGILTGKEKLVRQRIADTINRGTPKPNTGGRPGQIYEWDFGKPVGKAGPANGGGDLNSIRVIVDDGKVVTAFPY